MRSEPKSMGMSGQGKYLTEVTRKEQEEKTSSEKLKLKKKKCERGHRGEGKKPRLSVTLLHYLIFFELM